jgi:hypothetical protein
MMSKPQTFFIITISLSIPLQVFLPTLFKNLNLLSNPIKLYLTLPSNFMLTLLLDNKLPLVSAHLMSKLLKERKLNSILLCSMLIKLISSLKMNPILIFYLIATMLDLTLPIKFNHSSKFQFQFKFKKNK